MPLSQIDHDPEIVARRIDENGFDVIENYVSTPALEQAQRFIAERADDCKSTGSHFDQEAAHKNTFLQDWHDDERFIDFCREVSSGYYEKTPPPPNWKPSLRVLSGEHGQSHSQLFHYDSYVLTAMIPILMPRCPDSAQLILIPNVRSMRPSYLINVFDKLIVDSPLAQRFFKQRNKNKRLKRVPLIPGNLYLFWGYRSIHASDSFDPAETRCTAIMHFYDYHKQSKLKRFLSAYR